MDRQTLIAGIGNLLFSDEGIGVHAVRKLSMKQLGDNIEVLELGTATLDLPRLMEKKDKVVVVDAVLSDDPPGSVLRLSPGDLKSGRARTLTSMHQFGVKEALVMADEMGYTGEVVVVGAVPRDFKTPSTRLTPELAQALPALIKVVLAET